LLRVGGEEVQRFELLRRIEFTSDRKRMSALVRDPNDNLVKLLVKGADSVILERLSADNKHEVVSQI
jgi:magnesium-transporting ATPase (P-type)